MIVFNKTSILIRLKIYTSRGLHRHHYNNNFNFRTFICRMFVEKKKPTKVWVKLIQFRVRTNIKTTVCLRSHLFEYVFNMSYMITFMTLVSDPAQTPMTTKSILRVKSSLNYFKLNIFYCHNYCKNLIFSTTFFTVLSCNSPQLTQLCMSYITSLPYRTCNCRFITFDQTMVQNFIDHFFLLFALYGTATREVMTLLKLNINCEIFGKDAFIYIDIFYFN